VRRALREKYAGAGSRRDAMQAFVGIRKGRRDLPDTDAYVRQLRLWTRNRKHYPMKDVSFY
jgi:hypothetical protein